MKWKDFKEHCENIGVNDDTEVCYEDMNFGGNAKDLDKFNLFFDKSANELRVDSIWFADLD